MSLIKQHRTTARALGVVIAATLSLAACATKEDITAINTRLDQIDSRVASAAQSAESANQSAQRANQRLDQMEGRIQRLETQPARAPRG
jgi:murein lipoprotein